MKFQNIPYEKMDIGIILKLANDFKITVKNETKETEIIKYEKDTIIGNGIVNIEIIQTKQKNDIEHYFFFKSFQMDSKINTQHIFYDKNILNNEKIGISDYILNNQIRLLLLGPFTNSEKAFLYLDKTKPLAASKIISFITSDKYNFYLIDTYNLNLLQTKKNLSDYIKFIRQSVPGKF